MKTEAGRSAELPITLRPDWFAFTFFGALALLLWLPGTTELCGGLSHGLRDLAVGVSGSIVIFLLLYFWNIEIGAGGIAYRKLLFLKTFMPYSAIAEARIETSALSLNLGPGGPFRLRKPRRNRGKPVYCLLLLPRAENTPPLMINIKPFSRGGLALLIRTTNDKAPHVQFDAECE